MKEQTEMTEDKLTIETGCGVLKNEGDAGLAQFDITALEQLAEELERRRQFPYIVTAIYKETHARRWLLNRDENRYNKNE